MPRRPRNPTGFVRAQADGMGRSWQGRKVPPPNLSAGERGGAMDPELKAYLDGMQESLVTRMVDLNKETREHADHLHTQARVLIENVDKKVGLVWEGVQTIKESLGSRLEDHKQRIQSLERKAL